MKCIVCHHGDTQSGATTVAFHRDGHTLVVNEVPAPVCENCDEAYVTEEVAAELLRMAGEARRAQAVVLVRGYAPTAA